MTDKKRAALQAALEVLEYLESQPHVRGKDDCYEDLIAEIRAALAEPEVEQKPVAWMDCEGDIYPMPEKPNWAPPHTFLYTSPPRREWVGLTNTERIQFVRQWHNRHIETIMDLAGEIEAALKEKNA